jgi:sugar lactone lactonase YvrE
MELVTDAVHKPNGLCFSPDCKKLYIADTGGPDPKGIQVFEVDGMKLTGGRRFARPCSARGRSAAPRHRTRSLSCGA